MCGVQSRAYEASEELTVRAGTPRSARTLLIRDTNCASPAAENDPPTGATVVVVVGATVVVVVGATVVVVVAGAFVVVVVGAFVVVVIGAFVVVVVGAFVVVVIGAFVVVVVGASVEDVVVVEKSSVVVDVDAVAAVVDVTSDGNTLVGGVFAPSSKGPRMVGTDGAAVVTLSDGTAGLSAA
jgi:hypothetical protein